MFNSIFLPNKYNALIWANTLFLLTLLLTGYADAITIVLAYFMETIIIGILHCAKLYLTNKHGKQSSSSFAKMSGFGIILFFIVHYGMFVIIQSMFVFNFFSAEIPEAKGAFSLFHNFKFALQLEGMNIIIASLIFTNLGYFYTNFIAKKKYTEYAPSQLFFKPYARIFIQQFVVIFAGFFFMILPEGMAAALILLLLRLPIDLIMVAIRKDSEAFDKYAKKHSRTYEKYLETKAKYQEFSE